MCRIVWEKKRAKDLVQKKTIHHLHGIYLPTDDEEKSLLSVHETRTICVFSWITDHVKSPETETKKNVKSCNVYCALCDVLWIGQSWANLVVLVAARAQKRNQFRSKTLFCHRHMTLSVRISRQRIIRTRNSPGKARNEEKMNWAYPFQTARYGIFNALHTFIEMIDKITTIYYANLKKNVLNTDQQNRRKVFLCSL